MRQVAIYMMDSYWLNINSDKSLLSPREIGATYVVFPTHYSNHSVPNESQIVSTSLINYFLLSFL